MDVFATVKSGVVWVFKSWTARIYERRARAASVADRKQVSANEFNEIAISRYGFGIHPIARWVVIDFAFH